jgi:diguanylate cyclase (GGDEF)-like protein
MERILFPDHDPMSGKIACAVCVHYEREARAAIEAEDLEDAVLIPFAANCGQPPLNPEDVSALLDSKGDIDQVNIFGAACLAGFPVIDRPDCKIIPHKLEQCFHLAADPACVSACLNEGAYLTTPGWLAQWPRQMEKMGFDQSQARDMFAETASAIVLLDTGVDTQSAARLNEFADYVARPGKILCTGLAALRLRLVREYLLWRAETQKTAINAQVDDLKRQVSLYAMSLDLISNLARIVTESEAIEAMLDVNAFLFAPQKICYLSFDGGRPDRLWARPELAPDDPVRDTLKTMLAEFSGESGFTPSGKGFILRIVRRGEIRGVVAVEDIAFSKYIHQYMNLALSIGDICELPIENARKYEKLVATEEELRKANDELYRISTTDALTGIANRRAYDEYLDMEWKRMLRKQKPLSLIICDIDFFKKYNDHYGHEAGDACLHTVAQIIRSVVQRPGDFPARYGGEEFAVILPDTPAEGAYHIAERIRQAVVQHCIAHDASDISPCVTLSLGVVGVEPPPPSDLTPALMFRVADAALYLAKNQGRNRTVLKKIEAHTI